MTPVDIAEIHRLSLGDLCVDVRFDEPTLSRRFGKVFPNGHAGTRRSRPADLTISVTSDGREGRHSVWTSDRNHAVARSLSAGEAIAIVEHLVLRESVQRNPRYLAFHAAAVAGEGSATLLAGSGGSGKSALCAELVRAGRAFLTDEIALVDTTTAHVQPYPRSILLKPSLRDEVALESPLFRRASIDDGRTYVDWEDLRPDSTAPATPVEAIVFVAWSEHAANRAPRSLSTDEALHSLAAHCMNYGAIERSYAFNSLADLASSCRAYHLEFSDAAAVADRCP